MNLAIHFEPKNKSLWQILNRFSTVTKLATVCIGAANTENEYLIFTPVPNFDLGGPGVEFVELENNQCISANYKNQPQFILPYIAELCAQINSLLEIYKNCADDEKFSYLLSAINFINSPAGQTKIRQALEQTQVIIDSKPHFKKFFPDINPQD